MLTADVNSHEQIIEALQLFHRTGNLPAPAPAGLAINANTVSIQYGYNNNVAGTIQMTRGQFGITGVSIPPPAGGFNTNFTYNHAGTNTTLQNYIDALKNTNLGGANQDAARSALIILTSECCRSTMVLQAIHKLIASGQAFKTDVWNGLLFAFTNYSGTCNVLGWQIQAGGSPWTALKADDYIKYINSPHFTGDRPAETANINAVRAYIV